MTFFAKLDNDNFVVDVLSVNSSLPNEGADWLNESFGGNWIKTDKDTFGGKHLSGGSPLRKNYAGIGFYYDESLDAFIPPKPFDSWSLNEESCLWEAPAEYPTDGKNYVWNEETVSWIEVTE